MLDYRYSTSKLSLFVLLISLSFITCSDSVAQSLAVHPIPSQAILKNPGAGLVLPMWMNKGKKNQWYLKIVRVGYTRWTWAELEPRKGLYRFKKLESFCSRCENLGLVPAFRIMSTTTSGTATPSYVFREGVQSVRHRKGKQIDPVYWDPRYLDLYEHFIMAVGRFMNGGKKLEFIDIGGIGVWGEMHLGLFLKDMWTKKQLRKTFFSNARYKSAYYRMISIYKRAFPNTRLLLNISRFDDIAAYAASNGVGLRFDGLRDKYSGTLKLVSKTFRNYGLDVNHIKPVPCVYEFATKKMSFPSFEQAIYNALSDPISYLHLNIGPLSEVDSNTRELITKVARKIGYRLFLREARISLPDALPKKGLWGMKIIHEWFNQGIAPPTENYAICFELLNKFNKVLSRYRIIPSPPTTRWLPGKSIWLEDTFHVSRHLDPGVYLLRVSISDPRDSSKKISLAIKGTDKEGRYCLAKLVVRKDLSVLLRASSTNE